jgi:hypothetical protein
VPQHCRHASHLVYTGRSWVVYTGRLWVVYTGRLWVAYTGRLWVVHTTRLCLVQSNPANDTAVTLQFHCNLRGFFPDSWKKPDLACRFMEFFG